MSNAPAAPATTDTRVRIGRNGTKVHRGNADGNTYCGAQRRVGTRQGVTFLPADTAVTCTKCSPAAAAAEAAPAPVHTGPAVMACGHRNYFGDDECERCAHPEYYGQ